MPLWLVLKKHPLVLLSFWIILITALSLIDLSSIDIELEPKSWIKFDKIAHFIFYFVFTALLINYFEKKLTVAKIISISLTTVIYGIIIEILQDIVPTKRSFDYYDIIANTTGTIAMIILFLVIFKKK